MASSACVQPPSEEAPPQEGATSSSSSSSSCSDPSHIIDIVDCAPCLLYSYKINHVTGVSSFPFVSKHCQDLLGVSAQSVMADPAAMVNLVHPDDVAVFTNAVVKSMSDLSLFDQTLRLRNANTGHQYLNLLDRSQPYRDQEKNVTTGEMETVTIWKGFIIQKPALPPPALGGMMAPNSAISGEQEEEGVPLSLLMESPLVAFFTLKDGKIQNWNIAMTEATGYSSKNVVGKPVENFLEWDQQQQTPEEEEEDNNNFLDKLLQTSKLRCTLTSKTGNQVQLIVNATRNDDLIYVLCQDITQLTQVTKERNEATRLAKSERSLTEWLSHEIRNPLSVVMEAAQTLEAQQQQSMGGIHHENCSVIPDLKHSVSGGSYLQLIRHSITYVVDILTNMLDLNKLAEGKIILRPETCCIRSDILEPTQQMMGLCGKIPVQIDCPQDLTLQVDKLRLKQVMANLLSNAIKYTSQGIIRISVEAPAPTTSSSTTKAESSFLTIRVSDSGIGIQRSQYQHLFSRFEQLGSSVNGAGIGLCLCKNLLLAMSGDIYLNKDYHSGVPGFPGAQFVVRLPCDKKPPPPAFEALSAALISTATMVSGTTKSKEKTRTTPIPSLEISSKAFVKGRYRILVVDDELVGQKLLVKRFQRIFPQAIIDSSPSGEQALEMVTKATIPYDLITMDHYMKVSEWTGSETIEQLRSTDIDGGRCDSLIVGISGNAMKEVHVAAGADGFFQKPLPATKVVVQELVGKLPPPVSFRVLLVDDSEVNLQLMEQKLKRVSVPHAVKNGATTHRWNFVKCTMASRAKSLLEERTFDLVVLDQTLDDEHNNVTGIELGKFARSSTKNGNTILVLNSGSSTANLPSCFNLSWSKPLPSVEEIRRDLFQQLLSCTPGARSA